MKTTGTGSTTSSDTVNSPAHYATGEIECIDAMIAAYGIDEVRIYAKIAAFKYGWRRGKKDDEAQDVQKQIWYQRFSIGDDPRSDKKEGGWGVRHDNHFYPGGGGS